MNELDALRHDLNRLRSLVLVVGVILSLLVAGSLVLLGVAFVFCAAQTMKANHSLAAISDAVQWQMAQTNANSLDRFQAVDAVDHKVLYSFELKPAPDFLGMTDLGPGSVTPTGGGPASARAPHPRQAGGPHDLPPGIAPPAPLPAPPSAPVAPAAEAPAK